MFKVKTRYGDAVFTVYAISGTMFLVWNDTMQDGGYWEWMDMDRFKPVEEC